MKIKFASEIAREIEERGSVRIREGYVTGEAFEKWIYELDGQDNSPAAGDNIRIESEIFYNQFNEDLGEAA